MILKEVLITLRFEVDTINEVKRCDVSCCIYSGIANYSYIYPFSTISSYKI